jgi:hypothetical protein
VAADRPPVLGRANRDPRGSAHLAASDLGWHLAADFEGTSATQAHQPPGHGEEGQVASPWRRWSRIRAISAAARSAEAGSGFIEGPPGSGRVARGSPG